MKEKILCALRNNILTAKLNGKNMYLYLRNVHIDVDVERHFSKTITVEFKKTWWGKSYEKEVENSVFSHYTYYIRYNSQDYELTKEEYNDLFEYRKNEIARKQEEELDKLCKNN